jgi:hypothetical protein
LCAVFAVTIRFGPPGRLLRSSIPRASLALDRVARSIL